MPFYNNSIVPPLRLTFIMWAVFSFESFFNIDLGFLGILPRHLSGLIGIFTAPMIHGNTMHIASNTAPLIFLGATLYLFYNKIANRVFIQCYLLTGFLVWVFARPFYHIGASGLIYSLASFLISFGFFRKDFKSIIISAVILIFYGGLAYGVMPNQQGVSWESHLLGVIVGLGTAFGFSRLESVD